MFLDTLADGIILQQLGHLTFQIICDLVEKDVLTLVSIYIDKIGQKMKNKYTTLSGFVKWFCFMQTEHLYEY